VALGVSRGQHLSYQNFVFLSRRSNLGGRRRHDCQYFGWTSVKQAPSGTELFGLALALAIAGLVLTTLFWYIFKVNYHSVTILTARLRELDNLYKDLDEARQLDRQRLWYYRAFGRRGVNWVINNLLPTTTLLIWCIVASFAVAIFVSH
jgi:hypothetical protein